MSSAKVQSTGLPSGPTDAANSMPFDSSAAHLARREIRDDHHFAAHQIFRRVSERDARQNLPHFVANIDHQLKELVRALNALGGFHHADAQLDFRKVFDCDFGDRSSG